MELNPQNSPCIRGKFLGKGSYGTVSLGFRDYGEGVDSTVPAFAVKSARKGCVASIEALENEIEILRSISTASPFIVDYYGDSETTSSKELFIEYMPGGDVAGGGKKVVDVELIRSYTWCLVSALREVHANGIVHCDVKGSNVLVAGVGPENRVAKVADFGSAKRTGDGHDGAPRGSPLWWAPEVVRAEAQGSEADVWALGCTVIEMFTGLPAWQDNGAHTLYKIGYSNELPEFPARLSEVAVDFLGKCLVRDPGQRWSCDQLLEHPFLVPVAGGVVWGGSPKSVFDLGEWVGFSDDEGDVSEGEVGDDENRVSAQARIGELGGEFGVLWESDGWVEVRSVGEECCELGESGEEIIGSRLGVSLEIKSDMEAEEEEDENEDDFTWIKLSAEIDEMEIENMFSGGDDSAWCNFHDGRLCREVMRTEKDIRTVMKDFVLLLILFLRLYCSTNVGNMFSFDKRNENTLFPNIFRVSLRLNFCYNSII
ncbi:mitogen-activated protein kinase kinase kinase 18-like [Silene latifolia]|uniref:mitogen-activated protein kinase kinase kinase 18-like n=1 Tax=Silene latifolia TaxID=37657 RepID=UPI003D782527